jgi:hypothetical protein
MTVYWKVEKSYFESQLFVLEYCFKKLHSRTSICKKRYFLASIYEPLYYLKSCTIFDELSFINAIFYSIFLWVVCWLLAKISFLGPTMKFHNRTDIKCVKANCSLISWLLVFFLSTNLENNNFTKWEKKVENVCVFCNFQKNTMKEKNEKREKKMAD